MFGIGKCPPPCVRNARACFVNTSNEILKFIIFKLICWDNWQYFVRWLENGKRVLLTMQGKLLQRTKMPPIYCKKHCLKTPCASYNAWEAFSCAENASGAL